MLQTALHPKAGHRQRQAACPRAVVISRREDLCSEAQAYGNPFGARGQTTGSSTTKLLTSKLELKQVWKW